MDNFPRWLRWTALAALAWNLMGLVAVSYDTVAGTEGLSAAQQAIVAATPLWAKIGSWAGVIAGVAGSAALWRGQRIAQPLLLLSLGGVIAQYLWMTLLSDTGTAFGGGVLILQTAVLVIALGLVLLARYATRRGWLR